MWVVYLINSCNLFDNTYYSMLIRSWKRGEIYHTDYDTPRGYIIVVFFLCLLFWQMRKICFVLYILVCFFCLDVVLSVLLWFTTSYYPFDISKLLLYEVFLAHKKANKQTNNKQNNNGTMYIRHSLLWNLALIYILILKFNNTYLLFFSTFRILELAMSLMYTVGVHACTSSKPSCNIRRRRTASTLAW